MNRLRNFSVSWFDKVIPLFAGSADKIREVFYFVTGFRWRNEDHADFTSKAVIAMHRAGLNFHPNTLTVQNQRECVSDGSCASIYHARALLESDKSKQRNLMDAAIRLVKDQTFHNDVKYSIALTEFNLNLEAGLFDKANDLSAKMVSVMDPKQNPKGHADAHMLRATALSRLELLDEAEKSVSVPLSFYESKFGKDHQYTASAIALRAEIRHAKGYTHVAISDLDESAHVLYTKLGRNHPRTVEVTRLLRKYMKSAGVGTDFLKHMGHILRWSASYEL
jgi:hypothetical protein